MSLKSLSTDIRNIIKRPDFIWICICSLIVLLPNLFLICTGSDLEGNVTRLVGYAIVVLLLFVFPTLFLKAKVFFLLQGIFLILSPIEIIHIYLNKMPLTVGYLLAILSTETGEATEVLSSLKTFIFIFLIIYVFYFYVVIRKIKNTYIIASFKIKITLFILTLLFFLATYTLLLKDEYAKSPNTQDAYSAAFYNFKLKFNKIYPCNLLLGLNDACDIRRKIEDSEKNIQNFHFDARKNTEVTQREILLFVIGETARYSSFSINGYHRQTSPLLENTPNLVSFSDFTSEANVTSLSIPLILTRASALDFKRSFAEKSFPDAFKEAGYKTYWIANQSANNGFIRRIAKDTDGDFFSTVDFDALHNYDEKLWTYLDKILDKNDEKVLVVIHTLGSHFRYNFRYPESFDHFTPSLKGAFDYSVISPENKDLLINTYDNTILYTDYFLAHTIKRLENIGCVSSLIYVSDHAENLYDTPENVIMHAGSRITHYDFHVPLFVWTSDQYNNLYSDKVEHLQANKDKAMSMSNIFYSVLDMGDISFPEQILSKSFASDQLIPDSVRYVLLNDMTTQRLPLKED